MDLKTGMSIQTINYTSQKTCGARQATIVSSSSSSLGSARRSLGSALLSQTMRGMICGSRIGPTAVEHPSLAVTSASFALTSNSTLILRPMQEQETRRSVLQSIYVLICNKRTRTGGCSKQAKQPCSWVSHNGLDMIFQHCETPWRRSGDSLSVHN